MKRKITIALMISLLAAAVIAGMTAASSSSPQEIQPQRPITFGQITQIERELFTIQTQNGEQIEVLVSERTTFRQKDSETEIGFDSIAVGMWVAVGGTTNAQGQVTARVVVVLSEGFDPTNLQGQQVVGTVTQINNGQDTFTIQTLSGEELEFSVTEDTRYLNGLEDLQSLEHDMLVYVAAVEQDGVLTARIVAKAERSPDASFERAAGQLSGYTETSVSILLPTGSEDTYVITEETGFRSLDGSAASLSDLETGHVLVVLYQTDESGTMTAKAIIAAGEALNQGLHNLPRVVGVVQSAGGSHLTIQNRAGETVNFTVGEDTRIGGLTGSMELNDLKNGMRVLVLYTEADGGELYARVVLVGVGSHPNQPQGVSEGIIN